MFTTTNQEKKLVNAVQESPGRLLTCLVNRCEDQVIGFEFVVKEYQSNPRCCGNAIVNLCVPIDFINPIQLARAEFWATDDPCYKDWTVKKTKLPSIELQRNTALAVTGILVRFSDEESCCYPLNMAFILYGIDANDCKYRLSNGLLIFR